LTAATAATAATTAASSASLVAAAVDDSGAPATECDEEPYQDSSRHRASMSNMKVG
jgi:hypothetical protein